MLYTKNKMSLFIKMFLLFILILFSSSLYARHKCLSSHGNMMYRNGVLQENNAGFFGSCVHCEEVLCNNMVETILENEDQFCTETDCFFPAKTPSDYNLIIEDQFNWNKNKNLIIHTKKNITFERSGKIVSKKDGSIILKAGVDSEKGKKCENSVRFESGCGDPVEIRGKGEAKIYSCGTLESENSI